jgi:lysophospholipase L1-like esterase
VRYLIFLLLTGCASDCYKGEIVFWGDSLTARWHIEGQDHKIEGVQYIGFPGKTIEGIAENCVEAETIILQVGGNNIIQGEDAATVASKILKYKESLDGNVIIVSQFTGKGKLGEVMAEVNSYVEPDIYVNITEDDIWDYAHLNENGYRKWKEAYEEWRDENKNN